MKKVRDFYIKILVDLPYRIDAKMERYNLKYHLIDTGQDCTKEGSTQQH